MPVAFVSCASLASPCWQPVPASRFGRALSVFRFYLPAHQAYLPRLCQLLTSDEQARADRYRQAADQHRFVAGRALLRLLAGWFTNQRPDEVTICPGRNQKPVLVNAPAWHVNLSHAGEWVLLAVGPVAVGIDVEEVQAGFPYNDLLPTTFSPGEQAHIQTAGQPRWQFFDGWTRKEALLKATGQGLNDNLPGVPCLNGEHTVAGEAIGAAGSWTVLGFPVDEAYRAAIACQTQAAAPAFYTIDAAFLDQIL